MDDIGQLLQCPFAGMLGYEALTRIAHGDQRAVLELECDSCLIQVSEAGTNGYHIDLLGAVFVEDRSQVTEPVPELKKGQGTVGDTDLMDVLDLRVAVFEQQLL